MKKLFLFPDFCDDILLPQIIRSVLSPEKSISTISSYFYISSYFFSFDNATTKYPQAKYFNDDGDENLW